jgi:polar amino acid transport system substrate-binding protein
MILVSTACTTVDGGAQAKPAPSGKDCTVAKLPLKNKGRLTLATDQPAYEPWFSEDNPNNGRGYESALAFAVAAELGFTSEQVDWVVVGFNAMIAPGEKTFDAGFNQITITAQRRENVDLSAPYYTTEQAVVALEGSKLAGITTIAELRGAKLGAQADSTSLAAITDQVEPDLPAAELDSNDAGVTALEQGRIDGLVADLPTAVQLTSGQVDGGLVVGRIPPAGKAEQFGIVLDRGSKLTTCLNQAIGRLEGDGTLARLQLEWLELPDVRPLT